MIWTKKSIYKEYPFELESELESAIIECKDALFGKNRYYFDIKKKIGAKGKTNNIPDGYLLDLSDCNGPAIYVVENELSRHHIIKHIAVQILEFSLSFTSSKAKVKKIIREEILGNAEYLKKIAEYAHKNHYDNIDYLLENIFDAEDAFNVLLIIDETDEELENVLKDKFNFNVDTRTFKRYKNKDKDIIYDFISLDDEIAFEDDIEILTEFDTIVVPAREEGFDEVFIGEDCWYSIRINSEMIPKIKYIAAYQVAPVSAITHIAQVESIKKYESSKKYILYFKEPASEIGPILLGNNKRKAPQSPRYTSYEKLIKANTLDEIF